MLEYWSLGIGLVVDGGAHWVEEQVELEQRAAFGLSDQMCVQTPGMDGVDLTVVHG